jgi:hypothetical protein
MEEKKILNIYLVALEHALENDHHNSGFHVNGPDEFVEKQYRESVDNLLDNDTKYGRFFNTVGVYFDAKSHYATEIDGKDIATIKNDIQKQILEIRNRENLI